MGYMGILLFNIPKATFYLLKGDNRLGEGEKAENYIYPIIPV